MAKKSAVAQAVIRLRGVRHNNLKNFNLDLPLNQLIVITGLSGSGKSSLAFDTLFAEGQRRYIETFSPYARQFFDRMDKPQVDSIEGIPPAIAIEQRNSVKSTRSTVGTMTEICDHMKLLWPHISQLYCRQCGGAVRKDSPQQIWEILMGGTTSTASQKSSSKSVPKKNGVEASNGNESLPANTEVLITFNLPISEKLSLDESLALISKQGYQRLLLDGEILRLEEAIVPLRKAKPDALTIVQDRVKLQKENRSRFVEACEQAYHFGKGKLAIHELDAKSSTHHAPRNTLRFSNKLHCAQCDIEYREASSALFSFNHPVGACPTCRGFGRTITIDYNLALPDRSKTLAQNAVKPWQTGQGAESQADLMKFCRTRRVPTDVPFQDLPKEFQDWVINGDANYGKDSMHEWPRAWYGIKGYFRWLESKAYKMHVRVLLSRYRSYVLCPDCKGQRFQPEALLYKVESNVPARDSANSAPRTTHHAFLITLADFYRLPIRDAFAFIQELGAKYSFKPNNPVALVLNEVRSRLGYLNDVGLGYLTMDRPTRSLSGGETERVSLTTCLGTRLVNTLFVLDEPSVGLHPRDTSRLVRILEHLRNAGNTVVVVEHESSVMRAADQIVDIGPGHGATGGQIVFQGPYSEILKSSTSLTGQYLSGEKQIEIPPRRPVNAERECKPRSARSKNRIESPTPERSQFLTLAHASLHNLQDLTVEIPLSRFVCITGVSGSGKTTLAREVLLPLLNSKLNAQPSSPTDSEDDDSADHESRNTQHATQSSPALTGWEALGRAVLVDQSILGKTPRSNPAVYIGAFDDIRELFAQSEIAKQRGLNSSAFSFNSGQGQCERCRGAGFEKIEMQFLSDVFIRCPECNGRRYRPHILEIKLEGHSASTSLREMSIADLLDATVDEAIDFLSSSVFLRPAQRAIASLKLLQEVGLGYLRLGQPINTLSGGESQRLKLVRHLAEFTQSSAADVKPTLFLFDEPTTGLHFDDVRVLLQVFQRLVNTGHSVVIVEHNLDVIKSADWVIDLGPDAGDQGGEIVAQGTPEDVAACPESHTGQALKEILHPSEAEIPVTA
ncbi:MAG: excinuclease subunit [Pedosphaera sp.]|nr:excinuclease subunit [Pedosphaera sp.]